MMTHFLIFVLIECDALFALLRTVKDVQLGGSVKYYLRDHDKTQII